MKDNALRTITEYALLGQGERVTVGLSGGADSVALLCVLLELAPKLQITVSAFHVNHALRGAESDADEAFCRALCEKLGVSFASCRCDVAGYCKERRCSLEAGARALRYEALQKASVGGKLATAHHLEDNAETVLLNLVRGTALDGLCGIPVRRDNIVRPLLCCSRAEIEAYLAARGQDYRTDSTNLLNNAARNRLRHTVLPVLTELNPSFCAGVARTTRALSQDRAFLDAEADRLLAVCERDGALLRGPYAAAPDSLRLRVLRRLLQQEGIPFDAARLTACDKLILRGKGSRPLSGDIVLAADGLTARFVRREETHVLPCIQLDGEALRRGGEIPLLPGKALKIRILSGTEIKFFVNCRTKEYKNIVDCDRIKKPVAIRGRRAGDRLRLAGRGCGKSLKKLMNESAVPPEERDSLALLTGGEELLWLEGFGVSEKAAIGPETQRAFLLTITGEESQRGK